MGDTLQFFQQGLWLAIVISAPPLLIATLFGVLVSLVQAVTQVQDQTLPYVVKLLSVALTVAMLGRWFGAEIMQLAERAFVLIPTIGR
ncbi:MULTISPECIES: type III secretion system export apparatus subunit SctS [Massilia]|uniref:EscS/YscS/HrcS family type III secretion system export apparatus protein n=1 Tax=Massilia rubra TaxID=2607910 RepID=A0ABX0LIT4_9BURK|nr:MULTISPECIES: type III secretion system export apparatus subunit SctS [Massilia]NHZ32680.1 EscS/YscS/HrcS family type III secretion system export apparatus protein [Massilia rubra]NIA00618.1 EscS/YscS/HrcS family type III secretion system export apparatus protein [Massilia sp. CCM 8734]